MLLAACLLRGKIGRLSGWGDPDKEASGFWWRQGRLDWGGLIARCEGGDVDFRGGTSGEERFEEL